MKDKDNLILEHLYQEGLLDRIKARASGAKAGLGARASNVSKAVRGTGQFVKGAAQALTGSSDAQQSFKQGQKYIGAMQDAKLAQQQSKTTSIVDSAVNDLVKTLGNDDPDLANKLKQAILPILQQSAPVQGGVQPGSQKKFTTSSGKTIDVQVLKTLPNGRVMVSGGGKTFPVSPDKLV